MSMEYSAEWRLPSFSVMMSVVIPVQLAVEYRASIELVSKRRWPVKLSVPGSSLEFMEDSPFNLAVVVFPARRSSPPGPPIMDYDAYDALLHHIFKQVRPFLLVLLQLYIKQTNIPSLSNRLRVTRGSSLRRKTSTPAFVFESTMAIFVSFHTRIATSNRSKRPFAL